MLSHSSWDSSKTNCIFLKSLINLENILAISLDYQLFFFCHLAEVWMLFFRNCIQEVIIWSTMDMQTPRDF